MSAHFRKKNKYVKDPDYDPEKIKEADLQGRKVPDYLKQSPWYYDTGEGIEHLRMAPWAKQTESSIDEGYKHGIAHKEYTKYTPGCCKNCGSTQHTEKDCPERPRKMNAFSKGIGLKLKKHIKPEDLSYEAKRDNFSNYSTTRWFIESKQSTSFASKIRAEAALDRNDSGVEIRETFGSTSSRNREDTASYIKALKNTKPELIDAKGAMYDSDSHFVGPMERNKSKKKRIPQRIMTYELGDKIKQDIVERNEMRQQMRINENEFNERKVLLNQLLEDNAEIEEEIPKSERYEEDVFVNGHTSVWGSYYQDGKWGYACCHQFEKDSICTAQNEG